MGILKHPCKETLSKILPAGRRGGGHVGAEHNHYSLTCSHTGSLRSKPDDPDLPGGRVSGFNETRVSLDGAVFGRCPECGTFGAIETEWLLRAR